MSKERELLRKISRKTHLINYDEIEAILAQPEQEPLTATQIDKIFNSQLKEYGQLCDKSDFELFASSIEKAHGIGESDYGF